MEEDRVQKKTYKNQHIFGYYSCLKYMLNHLVHDVIQNGRRGPNVVFVDRGEVEIVVQLQVGQDIP